MYKEIVEVIQYYMIFIVSLVLQRPVLPLEDALKQIQESNLKSEVNLPSSHRPIINWR